MNASAVGCNSGSQVLYYNREEVKVDMAPLSLAFCSSSCCVKWLIASAVIRVPVLEYIVLKAIQEFAWADLRH